MIFDLINLETAQCQWRGDVPRRRTKVEVVARTVAIEARGATFNGAVSAVRLAHRFTWVHQLLDIGFDFDVPPSQIRMALREDRLYRVGMRLPGLGTVGLTFEGTGAEARAAWIAETQAERQRAEQRERAVARAQVPDTVGRLTQEEIIAIVEALGDLVHRPERRRA
jgi:hypothetical protein